MATPAVFLLLAIPALLSSSLAVPLANQCAAERIRQHLTAASQLFKECGEDFVFHNCCEVKMMKGTLQLTNETGQYTIEDLCSDSPFETPSTVQAWCDLETDGGGWLVIQRRVPNGRVNFTRNWEDYRNGFGDLEGEFWYGLDFIHQLTSRDEVELRIAMETTSGTAMTWTYQTFEVAGAEDKYRLTIGGGEGPGDDRMAYHNGTQFSTYDQDNDQLQDPSNCAYHYQGAWWYKNCYTSNLNGPHTQPSWPGVFPNARLRWNPHYLQSVQMMIRPKHCTQ